MRVHVVSDVHGNAKALAKAGEGADALVVLGDLVEFIDYADPTRGILGSVLGPAVSARFGRLRLAGRPGELAAFSQEMWSRFPDPSAVVAEAVREQYL
ncbi:MAG: metallophosphoesterase, partial [Pseudonocardiales bacterium]|nr:metallophosphoesterase [Pseudonocardiales bacterium]